MMTPLSSRQPIARQSSVYQSGPSNFSSGSPRVCLVSPGHIASNPRLVKEADTLAEAGYQVRVVAGDYMAAIRPLDHSLLAHVSWQWETVGLGDRVGYKMRRIRQELAKQCVKTGLLSLPLATLAHSPMSLRLAQAAATEPADLYIAHCLAALPAAAHAARIHQAKLGFDAEDFHVGELIDTPENQTEITIRDYLERTLLPQCDHLTSASPGIAAAYAKRYGVKMIPILNVFCRDDADQKLSTLQRGDCTADPSTMPSLYWFSQTVGSGRGLEAMIQAIGKMKHPVRLYLRGLISDEYRNKLYELAQAEGVKHQFFILPSAPPDEMVSLAAAHDIGLSLELNTPLNRDICLTNKVFTYLAAGLPVILSCTTAQIELAKNLGDAAILVNLDRPNEIAIALDKLFSVPKKLSKAKRMARKLGRSPYSWNFEKEKLLHSINELLICNDIDL